MKCDRLSELLRTGVFDMRPTEESLQIKARNQKMRKSERSKDLALPQEEVSLEAMIAALSDEIRKLKSELECT